MKDLGDKVVVVTGAASGIGRALAEALHSRGAILALVDRDVAGLEALVEALGGASPRISLHPADVSDRERMRALPAEVVANHGRVEVLINNAGVSVGAMFADHSIEDAEWLLGINLFGVLYGCKFFLPELLRAPEAHIVNLSSMFGLFAMPGQALYSTSKAAVRALTEALWTELADSPVRLTTVHPGGIRTNVIRSARMLDPEAQARAVALQDKYAMAPERAAEKILRAVARNRPRVLVGIDAQIGERLKRLFPVGFQRAMTALYRRGGFADLTGSGATRPRADEPQVGTSGT